MRKTPILKTVTFVCAAFVAASASFAEDPKPAEAEEKKGLHPTTRAAAKELMKTMKVREQLEPAMDNAAEMQKGMLSQIEIPAGEEEKMEKIMEESMKEVKEMMAWEKLEPMMIRVYASVFTTDELIGLDTFFKSKEGQVFINKQPELQKAMMGEMGKLMMNLIPKMQKRMERVVEEIQAAE